MSHPRADDLDLKPLGWSRVDPLAWRTCDRCPHPRRRAFWQHTGPDGETDLHLCTPHLCALPEVRALDNP